MITLMRHLRECSSGAALLETTIIFPLVLTLMFGIIDFGRAIQDYHTADKSMRSATRYLARVPAAAACDPGWGWTNAKNLAIYGTIDPAEGDKPLILGWAADTLTLDRDPNCPNEPTTIAIQADVPIPTPVISAIGFNSHVHVVVRHEERHIGG